MSKCASQSWIFSYFLLPITVFSSLVTFWCTKLMMQALCKERNTINRQNRRGCIKWILCLLDTLSLTLIFLIACIKIFARDSFAGSYRRTSLSVNVSWLSGFVVLKWIHVLGTGRFSTRTYIEIDCRESDGLITISKSLLSWRLVRDLSHDWYHSVWIS